MAATVSIASGDAPWEVMARRRAWLDLREDTATVLLLLGAPVLRLGPPPQNLVPSVILEAARVGTRDETIRIYTFQAQESRAIEGLGVVERAEGFVRWEPSCRLTATGRFRDIGTMQRQCELFGKAPDDSRLIWQIEAADP